MTGYTYTDGFGDKVQILPAEDTGMPLLYVETLRPTEQLASTNVLLPPSEVRKLRDYLTTWLENT